VVPAGALVRPARGGVFFARASCGSRTRGCGAWLRAGRGAAAADPAPLETPLDDADAGRAVGAPGSSARWRALADRLPPAELIDLVLTSAPTASSFAGRASRRRARTSRSSARSCAASRTAATRRSAVSRRISIACRGDESNASLDATNAVNLMTVHAAKGSSFRWSSSSTLPAAPATAATYIRIGTERMSGAASVAVGDFLSEYDEDAQAREAGGDQASALRRADAGRATGCISARC
jgi:hypothetical protein